VANGFLPAYAGQPPVLTFVIGDVKNIRVAPRRAQQSEILALLPIFYVARSSRTDLSMLVARALKIGKIAGGGMPPTYETMH
jgi:hypothetical protein